MEAYLQRAWISAPEKPAVDVANYPKSYFLTENV